MPEKPMKVVVQRVDGATVRYGQQVVASIGGGIVLYVGISKDEPPGASEWLVGELRRIRGADDHILCLSQFTLFGTFRGPKPSFHRAERPEIAEPYFTALVNAIRASLPCRVERGYFGKVLQVDLSGSEMETFLLERPHTA